MAIALDSTSNSNGASITSLSFSHTCSGSDRVLTVVVTSNRTVTSVTYNGVAMTQGAIATIFSTDSQVFYLVAPATGANNIVVSIGSSGVIIAGGISFTGASGVGANASGTSGGATSISTNITTTQDNSFVVASEGSNGATSLTFTQDSGQTESFEFNNASSVALCGAYKQIATAGTNAFQYTTSSSVAQRHALLEIKELVASGPTNLKSYNTNLKANIKSIDTNAIANVKSLDTNT